MTTAPQPMRCNVTYMSKKRGEKLTGVQVAARLGIRPSAWRSYVTRAEKARADGRATTSAAPAADGMLDGRTPFWFEATIAEFESRRRGRGWRAGEGR